LNRLGAWCDPGPANCPDVDTASDLVFNATDGTGSWICMLQSRTNLRRWVNITTGGRIVMQP
jgi:hypothetical protein